MAPAQCCRVTSPEPFPLSGLKKLRNGFQIKESLKKIVLPIDHSKDTLIKVPFTAMLAKLFKAEVHIVVVFTTNLKTMNKRVENYADKAKKYFDNENVSVGVAHATVAGHQIRLATATSNLDAIQSK